MLSALAGADGRFAANSLASAQASFAYIFGPPWPASCWPP